MAKPKVLIVYGTRPEAIKLAPVVKAFKADRRFKTVVASTGQHREMLSQVNEMFNIEPDYDIGLMHKKQPLNRIMSRSLKGLDKLLEVEGPDIMIVQGDTTTAMAAAIAGFNREVKIVHLEAGLRSGDMSSPFPEEANRKLITTIASLHLAPTISSRENLLKEGVDRKNIVVTGNTVIDALEEASSWDVTFSSKQVQEFTESTNRKVLVTTHRRENIHAVKNIGRAIARLADAFPDVSFIIPVHLNPLIHKNIIPEIKGHDNVCVTRPLPYDEFTHLIKASDLIVTDSGGIQEEAPSLGKPVLLMRNTSERPEAIDAGTVRLVGANEETIFSEVSLLLTDKEEYDRMAHAINPYGDGRAAVRTLAAVSELAGIGARVEQFNPTI
ncbi:MAG: UDP-N-acetylglucosamine 2-epimerase (non-hydrolyzing) [Corynebacterium casei]|uniref:non-hydrolyzing UDP-N-acetylglucosamine 2-epimerase n=1 Tax=Corynebacterium casei TaxID=160386 RepID=UPI0026478C0E|nr:UDP-N-acetylglucosamine 2-epimerase (non-hydrolyzing) [Corynebacterium casei]MDN5800758.1 UDP-N-acetylglucosamine 2-epimerase (non-hydrolyzing) [Corynebacterium casei]